MCERTSGRFDAGERAPSAVEVSRSLIFPQSNAACDSPRGNVPAVDPFPGMFHLRDRLLLLACGAALALSSAALSAASPFTLFSRPSRDVFIVTDVTPDGRKVEPPTRQQPVYCEAMSFGCDFGSMPGDKLPDSAELLKVIVKILADQGYQGNNDTHPPTLLLTFQWGYRKGGIGNNLAYLGGEKLDLMWETENNSWINSNVLLRNMRSSASQKVMDVAAEDIYAVTICGFDYASTRSGKPVLLWQTRVAIPTTGVSMANALPRILAVAGPAIGRETKTTVIAKADDTREGRVDLGELEVIEEDAPVTPAPSGQTAPAPRRR